MSGVSSADDLYSKLVGRSFNVQYRGIHPITSIGWLEFQITYNGTLGSCLQEIENQYEGVIWKGFVLGMYCNLVYVKSSDVFEAGDVCQLTVVGYGSFEFPEHAWHERQKYTAMKGYYMEVKRSFNVIV